MSTTGGLEALHSDFEGPEKRLELWFSTKGSSSFTPYIWHHQDLRRIPRVEWGNILALVKCSILSVKSNAHFDAYLLSESSLFVYPQRIILKTCGTTTPLHALEAILHMVAEFISAVVVDRVFYSRKPFFFPERQVAPYTSFEEEAQFLDLHFTNAQSEFASYTTRKIEHDLWYFYMARRVRDGKSSFDGQRGPRAVGTTLELMMTGLPRENMAPFMGGKSSRIKDAGAPLALSSGISEFVEGTEIDEFAFDPSGYSCNGLLDATYLTVHITPQPHCSFVSFETNEVCDDYSLLVSRVLATFCPLSCTLALFSNQTETEDFRALVHRSLALSGNTACQTTLLMYALDPEQQLAVIGMKFQR